MGSGHQDREIQLAKHQARARISFRIMVGTLVLAAATLLAAWFGLELPGVHSIAWPLVSLPGLLLAVAAIPSGLVGLNELREVRKAREDLQRPAT